MGEKNRVNEGARGPSRILIIDDYPDERRLIKRELKREFPDLNVNEIIDAKGFDEALRAGGFHAVITDYQLGWSNGLEILRTIKTRYPDCPVIMLTGTGTEEIALEAMRAGLDDYVLKSADHFRRRVPVSVHHCLEKSLARQKNRQAEEALQESEETYRTLFEQSGDARYVTTREGRFVEVNQAVLDLFGYTRGEMTELKAVDTYVNPDDRLRFQEEIEQRGSVRDFEVKLRKKDGREMDCLLTATVRQADDGSILGYQGMIRDITDRKVAEEERERLEAQLFQSQKMEAIGTLAAGIAHDFNNILTAIIGYADLARMKIPDGRDVIPDIDQILKSANRAKSLVQQILTVGRKHEQERRPIKLKYVVKEVLKLLRATLPSTIEIKEDIPRDGGVVNADPTQMHQVLMNLCTNASHAMREGVGVLEVGIRNVEVGGWDSRHEGDEKQSAIRIPPSESHLAPGHYVRLTVRDTGVGMTSEVTRRVFEPYFTTKERGEGTGMGLSVVHGIVERHGGAITVESKPGEGSTFHVYLPRTDQPQAVAEDEAEEPLPTGKGRVLFIDDEATLVEMGREILEHLGYQVATRKNALEALELFRKDPDRFDLVITDLTMPKMTGIDLAQKLMAIRPDIPIILSSGFADPTIKKKVRAAGIRDFIAKPFKASEIAQVVKKVLD